MWFQKLSDQEKILLRLLKRRLSALVRQMGKKEHSGAAARAYITGQIEVYEELISLMEGEIEIAEPKSGFLAKLGL